MVKKSTFGKVLMILAIAWFISLIHIGIDSHVAFWSALGIGVAGLLLWMYGDTGIPKLSDRMLDEIESHRSVFWRRRRPKVARKKEKDENSI